VEPLDRDDLTDQELDALLREWKAPEAPARLRAALFPNALRPRWKTLWTASIRIPVPAACCLALLLLAAAVYRDRVTYARALKEQANIQTLQPVDELRPRILRSMYVSN
jgi:hypothetical protein